MARTVSHIIAAGVAALSLSAGAFANDPFPMSPNESGSVYPQHEATPAPATAVGVTGENAPAREVGSANYEVRTPSSVDESAPWRTGIDRR